MADPVAARSSFLSTYMSQHPETLLAYILHAEGSRAKHAKNPSMISIDTQAMILAYSLDGHPQQTKIVFDPPLAGYEEVRPRLVALKQDAEESIGMDKSVNINHFSWHPANFLTLALVSFLFLSSLPEQSSTFPAGALDAAKFIRSKAGGWPAVAIGWGIALAFHSVFTLYAARLTRIHPTPRRVRVSWLLATFLLGSPSIFRLRAIVRDQKIASARKNM